MKRKLFALVLVIISILACFSLAGCLFGDDGKVDLQVELTDFTIQDGVYYLKVNNEITEYSFEGKVKVAKGNEYKLSKKGYGNDFYDGNSIRLNEGDNNLYILVRSTEQSGKEKYHPINIYRMQKFSVYFNTNGGTNIPSQKILEGGYATMPTQTPIRTGFTFSGWSFDFNTPITRGITVNAIWQANEYTVTFNSNGGSEIPSKKVFYFDTYNELLNPTRSGYTFAGWFTEQTFENEVRFNYRCTTASDHTLYAKWEIITYVITYDLDGGEVTPDNPTTYTVEDAITLNNPTQTGYNLIGWQGTDVEGIQTTVTIPVGSTGDREYTAIWEGREYLVSFVGNGVENPDDLTVTFGGKYDGLPKPERFGYFFWGWFTEQTFESSISSYSDVRIANDHTLYAKWVATRNRIDYQLDGGEVSTANPTYYTVEDTVTLNNPTKTGYTFTGWTSDIITTPTTSLTLTWDGEIHVYTANWQANQYTVYLTGDYIPEGETVNVTYDSDYTVIPEYQYYGYDFLYWRKPNGNRLDLTEKVAILESITLTAVWDLAWYDAVQDWGYDGIVRTNEFSYKSSEIKIINPTRYGYDFIGWTGTGLADYTKDIVIPTNSVGDRVYTANWQLKEVEVAFDGVGGVKPESKTVTFGEKYGTLPVIEVEGYRHLGWRFTSNGKCYDVTADTLLTYESNHRLDPIYELARKGEDTFTRIDKDGTANANGEYILFGSYPQTYVAEMKEYFTWQLPYISYGVEYPREWHSYGYYLSGEVVNYMWYKDFRSSISGKEEEYRAVYIQQYRTKDINGDAYTTSQEDICYQYLQNYFREGQTASEDGIYVFKFEPIRWKIVSQGENIATLVCDMVLDATHFDTEEHDYSLSDVRSWLNYNFYHTAFSPLQQQLIQLVEVDNSPATTDKAENKHCCENTLDKVYLLSYQEVDNEDYYFSSWQERYRPATDYAFAQGLDEYTSGKIDSASPYLLRSPYSYNENEVLVVYGDGGIYGTGCGGVYGVVPVIQVDITPPITEAE